MVFFAFFLENQLKPGIEEDESSKRVVVFGVQKKKNGVILPVELTPSSKN
jgi:hypothetical protein